MKLGITLPLVDIQGDPATVRDFAQAAEGLGYDHLGAPDHVLGVNVASRPDWGARNTSKDLFHDPFVLFGFLSACTREIEFSTQVMILPQRQTALVAKQAAEVDVLSGGRMRLGVGVGWNEVEYEGLDKEFSNRGARSEEQIALLRELWTKPVVTFSGRYHSIDNAGIKPLPAQRPIPVWIGGYAEATLQRVAALGDGWFPWIPPDDRARAMLERLRELTRAAGRQPESIGIEPQLSVGRVPEAERARYVQSWRDLGATHLCVNTMGAGFTSPAQHLAALERVARDLGVKA
jgi:probable F420-dependent oxidoreductase